MEDKRDWFLCRFIMWIFSKFQSIKRNLEDIKNIIEDNSETHHKNLEVSKIIEIITELMKLIDDKNFPLIYQRYSELKLFLNDISLEKLKFKIARINEFIDLYKSYTVRNYIIEISSNIDRILLDDIIKKTCIKSKGFVHGIINDILFTKLIYGKFFIHNRALVFDNEKNTENQHEIIQTFETWKKKKGIF